MSDTLKKILILSAIVVVLFLILNAKIGFFKSENTAQAGVSSSPAMAIPVSVEAVKPERLERKLNVTGTIVADESIEIRSETSGIVTRIFFKEGQQVRKGQLLLSIDDEELKAQLEKLKIRKDLLEATEFRAKKLLEREAISQEEYDITLNELKSLDADIKTLETQIEKKHIRAPFTGIVGLRQISEGSYVSNNERIANLYSMETVKLDFSVPGKYSHEIRAGQKIFFKIENIGQVFEGSILAIEPMIDPNTRTLQIRGIAQNEHGLLLPGQFASIEIILETIDSALMVPTISVIPELGGHKLYKYVKGKVESAKVEIGQRTDNRIQIISGVSAGDTILTSGILQVRDGSPVVISNLN